MPRLLDPKPLLAHVGELNNSATARALGTSRRQVIRWRNGQRIKLDTADAICDRIGVNPHQLWELE